MKTTLAPLAIAKPAVRLQLGLAGLYLSTLMASLDTSIVHTALPTLMQVFGASFRGAQWIVLAYLASVTSLVIVVGRIGDMLGRRPVLMAGLALFTGASVLCAYAPALPVLLAARALQGAGAAVMTTLTVALIADLAPGARRGRAIGLAGTMSAIGTTLGPTVGGMLTAALGWQAIFLVNVPISLAVMLLTLRFLPADAPAASARVPSAGMLVLWRQPGIAPSVAMTTLVASVVMTTLVVGPFFLARTLGYDVAEVGMMLSIGPLVAALSGMPAGVVVDRCGTTFGTRAGLSGMLAGCLLIVALPASLTGYLAPVALITASYALFQAANGTAVMNAVGAQSRGAAAGLLGLARNLGLMLGAWLMGAVFSAAWAGAGAVHDGLRAAFALAAGLMGAALLLSRFAVLRPVAAEA